MPRRSVKTEGWALVAWTALAATLVCAVVASVYGVGPDGLRLMVRATARISLLCFCAAFAASSLVYLWPGRLTAWMRRNRRYLGLSFAASHTAHLATIIAAAVRIPDLDLDAVTLTLGGLGYVFIAAMAATSFDRSAAWLGPRRWKQLHTAGSYYLWSVFAFDYVGRALFASAAFAPPAVLILGTLGVRLAARRVRVARTVDTARGPRSVRGATVDLPP